MTDNITLRRWANANEDAPETEFQRGYDAARRWVREVGLPALAEPEKERAETGIPARGVGVGSGETDPSRGEAYRTPAPDATHPGYIIGSHWLETAYSRVCAGEAEADVLRDCGWERVTDAEALRRDAERYRWMTEDHQENETRRRVYSVTLLFNAHRKEHIDAAIDAAMEPATEPAIGATGES